MTTCYGIFIRELRSRNNITMKQLALSLGVSPSYLSSLELGKKGQPSKIILNKISTFFELNKRQEEKLFLSVKHSQKNIKLPKGADPEVYRIGYIYSEQAFNLSIYQLEIIEKVLAETPLCQRKERNKMNIT